MITRSNWEVSDSVDASPASARSASSSPVVASGATKLAISRSFLAVARNSSDPALVGLPDWGPCCIVNRFMRR